MSADLGFCYRSRKDGSVEVLHHGQPASTLRGRDATRFVSEIETLSHSGAQQLIARVTGNYMRGNERAFSVHLRNRG